MECLGGKHTALNIDQTIRVHLLTTGKAGGAVLYWTTEKGSLV